MELVSGNLFAIVLARYEKWFYTRLKELFLYNKAGERCLCGAAKWCTRGVGRVAGAFSAVTG